MHAKNKKKYIIFNSKTGDLELILDIWLLVENILELIVDYEFWLKLVNFVGPIKNRCISMNLVKLINFKII